MQQQFIMKTFLKLLKPIHLFLFHKPKTQENHLFQTKLGNLGVEVGGIWGGQP